MSERGMDFTNLMMSQGMLGGIWKQKLEGCNDSVWA